MESMINDNGADDLFDGNAPADNKEEGAQPENTEELNEQPDNQDNQQQQDNEDDIYAAYNEPAAEPEKVSALVEWQKKKNAEITELDEKEEEDTQNMKQKASDDLAAYYRKLEESQEKRKAQNKEVDENTIDSLHEHHDNKWERVVSYIDFNRSEFHTKDVSRMKALLLQLKH